MLMHRLNTSMDINVKEIMPKEPPKVHNRKTIAGIKDLEWDIETKLSTVLLECKFIIIGNCLCNL